MAGYCGKILRINLDASQITKEDLDLDLAKKFVGGRGLGTHLTRLLLERAFNQQGARRVTLVVFPENHRALACYRAAGLREAGAEMHYFPPCDRRVRLLKMDIVRAAE